MRVMTGNIKQCVFSKFKIIGDFFLVNNGEVVIFWQLCKESKTNLATFELSHVINIP